MKRPKRLLGIIAALAVMTSTIVPVYANQVDPEWYSLYEEDGYEEDTEDTEDDTAEEDDPYSVEIPTAVQAPAQTPAETDTITDTAKPDDSAPEEKVTLGMSLHLDELEEDDVTKDDVDWCEWDPVTGTMTLKGQLPDTSLSSTFADQAGIDKSLIKKVYASPYGATAGAKLDYAFYGLTNLQEAYLYTLKGITGSTSAIGLFTGCSSLRYVNIYYWGNLDTASTKTLGLFAGCSSIEMLTLPKGFEFDTLTGLYNKQNSCLGWTKDDSLDIIGGDGTYAIFTTSASGTYIRRRTDWYEWDGSTLTLKGKLPLTAIGTSLADIAGIDNEAVKKAVIRSDTTASISLKSAFSDFYNLESVEHLNYLDTSDVTDMRYMFEDCRSLTKLEFGSFGTKNLQSMSYMFSYCYKLEELDIYSFDMSNVLHTDDMFSYCSKLSSLCLPIGFQVTEDMKLHNIPDSGSTYTGDILGWAKYSSNTIVGGSGKYAVFTSVGGYYEFRKLQWYEWNESTHTFTLKGQLPDAGPWIGEGSESHNWNFAEMAGLYWSDYTNIEKVIIKPNTKAGTSLAHAFENFKNLTEIQGLANLDTSATEDMGYMFHGCFSLTSLDLSKFNTAKVKDMACMFYECESLTSLILPDSDISACDYMDHIFKGCKALPALDLSGFKNLTGTIVETFAGCDALTSLTLPAGFEITNHMCLHKRIGNDSAVSGWAKAGTQNIISTEYGNNAVFTADTAGEYVLISIKWYEWDESTGTLTLMNQLPSNGGMGRTFDTLAGIEAAKVKKVVIKPGTKADDSLSYAFYNFKNLTAIDGLKNLDTSAAKSTGYMFAGCSSLKSLDLSNFDTSGVVYNMYYMFEGCVSLTSIDLSKFDMSKVMYADAMFDGCTSLRTVNMPTFDHTHIPSTPSMFEGCTSLTSVKFKTDAAPEMMVYGGRMFKGCTSLTDVDLSSIMIYPYSNDMFKDCTSLRSLKLSAGTKIEECMCLANKDENHSGWLLSGNDSVISGDGTYAVFTANTAGTYVRSPKSPDIIKVEPGYGKMTLSWTVVDGAEQYLVYFKNSTSTRKITRDGRQTGAYIGGIANGTYDVWVTVVVGGIESKDKKSKTTVLKDYGVTCKTQAVESGAINITWNKVEGATRYRVVCVDKDCNVRDTRTTSNLSFKWAGLHNGDTYGFYIQPYINGVYPTFVRTDANDKKYIQWTCPVNAPMITKLSLGNQKVWLYYESVPRATKYYIYYRQKGDTKDTLAGTTTATKFLVTKLKNNVSTEFYVKALVDGKLTPLKRPATRTTRAGMKPTITVSAGQAALKWSKYTDCKASATKYKVVLVNANYKQIDYRETANLAFTWKSSTLKKGTKYGFYVVPYVNGEYIPFGLSHAEDKANVVMFTAK